MTTQTVFQAGRRSAASAAVILALLLTLGQAQGSQTVNAASVDLSDVQAAVNSASPGDTVTIPAGTANWSSYLDVSKGITIQGQTTISGGDNPDNFTANDQTIIVDESSRSNRSGTLIAAHPTTGDFRMTGLTFRSGNTTSTTNFGSTKLLSVAPATCRIDHCHYDSLHAESFISTSNGCVFGVADHNLLFFGHHALSFEIFHPNWGGKNYGDGSWSAPTGFGGSNFFFIETNLIRNPGNIPGVNDAQTVGAIDSYAGGRYVARFNTFINCVATDHGTETPGRLRSVRAAEVYNNKFEFTATWAGNGGILRGGCLVYHDNNFVGNTTGGCALTEFRSYADFVFPGAKGNGPWDLNSDAADHTGNEFGGGPNGLFATGTNIGTTTNAHFIVVSGNPYRANQWIGYVAHNTTTNRFSWVASNTSNTIKTFNVNFDPNYDPNGNLYWNNGDKFEVYKVPTAAMDQLGRGQGDLVSGDPPHMINTTTRTPSWPHQTLEPIYSWDNNVNGTAMPAWFGVGFNNPQLVENRDFYNNTPMPGYTPYTYPHPLVSGRPMPTLPGSPPPATAKPSTTTTPGFTHGFRIKKKQNAETAKSKKIPGRSD